MNTGLSRDLLPDEDLLKIMFLTILDMKSSNRAQKNQNSAKDKITRFNICVAIKRRKYDDCFECFRKFRGAIHDGVSSANLIDELTTLCE